MSGAASPRPASASPGGSRSAAASAPASPGASPSGRPSQPGDNPARTYRVVGEVGDGRGDLEGGAPAYGDLAGVRIEDGGDVVRVTVFMHGPVPQRLPADELLGVGVDFFQRLTQTESDYQLFVDGQPDGWYAYLHTPRGFVRYPGTFGIADTRLVFEVPWSALGGQTSGRFSAFADWSRKRDLLNESGEDHAPDLGSTAWSR